MSLSLKDELFNEEKVRRISKEIQKTHTAFEAEKFVTEVVSQFPNLELKERMYHIRDVLTQSLPNDYSLATSILLDSLPDELDNNKTDDDFGEFIYGSYAEFVTYHGCNDEYLSFSLGALREITKRFSVEFAIRDFINKYPTQTLKMLHECAESANYHERRLASEALRPKLPWAKKIEIDYKEPIKHLDKLFYDNTRFVTRSVANHLNDIAKIDADFVIKTLKRWKKSQKQNEKEMAFIIKHALRTLIKQGNSDALEMLGFRQNPEIVVRGFSLRNEQIKIGEYLEFFCEIEAKEDVSLLVDYLIYFQTKNGKLSPKVYKMKQYQLKCSEKITIEKAHLFKAGMTTRNLVAGEHKVQIQINGRVYKESVFFLEEGE